MDLFYANRRVLETLANTRMDAKKTEESIGGLEEKYKEAQIIVSDILDKLITKTSMMEQLKAVLGKVFSLFVFSYYYLRHPLFSIFYEFYVVLENGTNKTTLNFI